MGNKKERRRFQASVYCLMPLSQVATIIRLRITLMRGLVDLVFLWTVLFTLQTLILLMLLMCKPMRHGRHPMILSTFVKKTGKYTVLLRIWPLRLTSRPNSKGSVMAMSRAATANVKLEAQFLGKWSLFTVREIPKNSYEQSFQGTQGYLETSILTTTGASSPLWCIEWQCTSLNNPWEYSWSVPQ